MQLRILYRFPMRMRRALPKLWNALITTVLVPQAFVWKMERSSRILFTRAASIAIII